MLSRHWGRLSSNYNCVSHDPRYEPPACNIVEFLTFTTGKLVHRRKLVTFQSRFLQLGPIFTSRSDSSFWQIFCQHQHMCEWFVATNILAEEDKPSNATPTKFVAVSFFNEKLVSRNARTKIIFFTFRMKQQQQQ